LTTAMIFAAMCASNRVGCGSFVTTPRDQEPKG
jgi:hypothetical protein